jgi:hypothetical protein
MDKYDLIFESLQDKLSSGDLTLEAAELLNDLAYDTYVMQEGLGSPLKNKLEQLKAIKDTKPDEYDGPADVKKYIDKNYDEIVKASEILQNEPKELTKENKKYFVRMILELIGYIVGACTLSMPVVIISCVIMMLDGLITSYLLYVRSNDDVEAMKNLSKVKSALKRINVEKLPPEYKKKMSKIIQSVNDAETDVYSKFKNVKESPEEIYNLFADVIQESIDNGELTEEEANDWNDTVYSVLIESTDSPELDNESITLEEAMSAIDELLTEKSALDAVKSLEKKVGGAATGAAGAVSKTAKKEFAKAKNFAGDSKALKDLYKSDGKEALELTNNKAKKAFAVAGASVDKASAKVSKAAKTAAGASATAALAAKRKLTPKKTVKPTVTKESVDEMRLRVYDAFEEGTISEEEKDTYLDYLNLDNYE